MANENNKQTKFEELLSRMSLEEKDNVFKCLSTVVNLLKDYAERAGYDWLVTMACDEPLRNLFSCEFIAGQMWFNEQREKELQNENNEP